MNIGSSYRRSISTPGGVSAAPTPFCVSAAGGGGHGAGPSVAAVSASDAVESLLLLGQKPVLSGGQEQPPPPAANGIERFGGAFLRCTFFYDSLFFPSFPIPVTYSMEHYLCSSVTHPGLFKHAPSFPHILTHPLNSHARSVTPAASSWITLSYTYVNINIQGVQPFLEPAIDSRSTIADRELIITRSTNKS